VEEELAVHYGDPWFDNGFLDYLTTLCHSDCCSELFVMVCRWWGRNR